MDSVIIFLDESGDLGWKFDAPYRQGGSSRYLTIGALVVPSEKKHLPKRVVAGLHDKFNWKTAKEKKWVDLPDPAREHFAAAARKLVTDHSDISHYTITATKENVLPHIRADANKLYNYMIRLLLLDEMAKHARVTLVPDPRSIKVESGNSLHDYLQTELWFTKNAATTLHTRPTDSKTSLGLQYVDWLAGVVQSHFEDRASKPLRLFAGKIKTRTLFA